MLLHMLQPKIERKFTLSLYHVHFTVISRPFQSYPTSSALAFHELQYNLLLAIYVGIGRLADSGCHAPNQLQPHYQLQLRIQTAMFCFTPPAIEHRGLLQSHQHTTIAPMRLNSSSQTTTPTANRLVLVKNVFPAERSIHFCALKIFSFLRFQFTEETRSSCSVLNHEQTNERTDGRTVPYEHGWPPPTTHHPTPPSPPTSRSTSCMNVILLCFALRRLHWGELLRGPYMRFRLLV